MTAGGTLPDVIWYGLALVLVGSALASRRISLSHGLAMVLIWVAIFGIVAFLYGHREQVRALLGDQRSATAPVPAPSSHVQQTGRGGAMTRIAAGPDGHYWVQGRINGYEARFLIDSGASVTALTARTAQAAGLNVDTNGPGVALRTANGPLVARRANAASIALGEIRLGDVGVVVSDTFGDINVIGINFLSRLRSWKVENGEMILEQ